MIRAAVLATVLLLPQLAPAEEVWRWRDPSGRLHYSNVRAHAPGYAEPVQQQIGHASLPHLAAVPVPRAKAYEAPREPGIPFRSEVRALKRSCWPFGYPYVVINNPHELSDQVKQASLLDALGVPWRKGCCL